MTPLEPTRETDVRQPAPRRAGSRWILAAILACAAGLRVYAIDFGAGLWEVRPDEGCVVAAASSDDPLLPEQLLWGGAYFQPLRLYMRAARAVGLAESLPPGVPTISERNRLVARTWSALLSIATVALTWTASCRLTSTGWAWLAPALIAVAPLAVREAHFAKADTAAGCAAALVVAALAAPRGRPLIWAAGVGTSSGIAIGTKLTLGPLLGSALALARPEPGSRRWIDARTVAIGSLSVLVAIALLHPFLVTMPAILAKFAAETFPAMMRPGRWTGSGEAPPPWTFYPVLSLWYGFGAGPALLAAPALLLGLARRGPTRWIALGVVGHVAALLSSRLVLSRYFLQALPGLAVLIAILVERAVRALRETSVALPARRLAALVVVAALLGPSLLASTRLVRLLGRADTRAQAALWIERNVPADAVVALYGGPTLWTGYGNPPLGGRRAAYLVPPARWDAKGVTWVVSHSYPMPYANRPLSDTTGLERKAVFDPFADGERPLVVDPMDAFFLPLGRLSDVTRPGPKIEIFARRPGSLLPRGPDLR